MHIDQPLAAKKLRLEMIPTDRLYARLVVLASLVEPTDPAADWRRRMVTLVARYPEVALDQMGMPAGWNARPFWA